MNIDTQVRKAIEHKDGQKVLLKRAKTKGTLLRLRKKHGV